jgi:hypothetical protein
LAGRGATFDTYFVYLQATINGTGIATVFTPDQRPGREIAWSGIRFEY